ncbi:MAG: serine hydrolase [Candidatus Sumerlaeia bacterium]|nr:serine hydrolase [Candidatus Sumerlaeia bacterium]
MRYLIILALVAIVSACGSRQYPMTLEADPMRVPAENLSRFEREVTRAIAAIEKEYGATIGVSLKDDSLEYNYNGDRLFHAASTMKVPVMVAAFRLAETGYLSLDQTLTVRTQFNSIVDGSPYEVAPRAFVRERIGEQVPVRDLIREMIQVSDNVATNLLLERITSAYVTRTMRDLGSNDGYILRNLEDGVAFRFDISNKLSPRDLTNIARAIQLNQAASSISCAEMREILGGQQHRTMIPARLPQGTLVYHKTGSITGHRHDTGIVSTHVGNYYLTIMTEANDGDSVPVNVIAELSEKLYTEWTFLRE